MLIELRKELRMVEEKEERIARIESQYKRASRELKVVWGHWDEVAVERAREEVREIILKKSLEVSA